MNFIYKNEVIDYDHYSNHHNQTIIFLHGWGGNKFSFSSSINLLKDKFDILAITLPTIDPTTVSFDMFDYTICLLNLLQSKNINKAIIVCHSFGFRVACLLKCFFKITKIVVTGGAGLKKSTLLKKINTENNKILLAQNRFKYLYSNIASRDYLSLSKTNKKTFQNVVNLNLNFAIKFDCPMLLFWGRNDKETPVWVAKKIKKSNTNCKLILTNSDHFSYLKENALFNHFLINFLK